MKKCVLSVMFMVLACIRISAAEIVRYDFQISGGEGTQELYRVDVDLAKKNGELCFFNTGSSGIPEETLTRIRKGALWSKHVDMQKEDHGCFKFELYGPLGWFYSPSFKYLNQVYRFFFVGEVKKESFKGTLYKFIDIPDGNQLYRMIEEQEVSTPGIIIKK